MRAGWGRVEFTPVGSVPLAGYGHLRDRMSTHVRDPLFVRALAFDDGTTCAVLVIYDLLMVTESLHSQVLERLADTGARVMVHATHSHSALGGFGRGFLIEKVCGRHRPGTVERLADAGADAARRALGSLAPAKVGSTVGVLPGHNGNRRDPAGPVDDQLTVLRIRRAELATVRGAKGRGRGKALDAALRPPACMVCRAEDEGDRRQAASHHGMAALTAGTRS